MSADWNTIDTDVLVVGGGVAGCMAAIPALEAGLKVVVCEKGKVLDHCGSVGCGVDHYLTIMEYAVPSGIRRSFCSSTCRS